MFENGTNYGAVFLDMIYTSGLKIQYAGTLKDPCPYVFDLYGMHNIQFQTRKPYKRYIIQRLTR